MKYLHDSIEQPKESHVEQEEQRHNENTVIQDDLMRSTRIRKTPYLEDYHHQMMITPYNKIPSSKVLYPLDYVIHITSYQINI